MEYRLWYKTAAQDSDYGWENESLPLGCGYLGANVFGIVPRERIQITENSLQNPQKKGGLNNFAEIYVDFPHQHVSDYERGLHLNDAEAYVKYTHDGIHYKREYLTSYPHKVFVARFSADRPGSVSLRLSVMIPYVRNYSLEPEDGCAKTGQVSYEGTKVCLQGHMEFYNIHYAGLGQLCVRGGHVQTTTAGIEVKQADEVTFFFAAATNYVLEPRVFLEENPKKKLRDFSPVPIVQERIENAVKAGWVEVENAHKTDFRTLFDRVSLAIGTMDDTIPTDELLKAYAAGKDENNHSLECLYFQYGRYLLISSSRKGALPPNLQGTWNVHDIAPWGSGYWHNINIQMNYWPVFVTNLHELFESYIDFNNAFQEKTQQIASEYIRENYPEYYEEGQGRCGWTIGTANFPYLVVGPGGHSGPGTGGLTTRLYWDYYDFTRDEKVLRDITYPMLHSMARFLLKTVVDYDGLYLTKCSASPEQFFNREYTKTGRYYETLGCAFDQQMIYDNGQNLIKAADLLNRDDDICRMQREQIDHYDPITIGWSGQVKEYAEENLYGEIGQYTHRHISQLVALYPGNQINAKTPAWMDAAKYTLTQRGDDATGWALAHRVLAWARTGDGEHTYRLLRRLLGQKTMKNLWDLHPPFQIDGNFGGTAGIAEMLLQSHEDAIELMPAIPECWDRGEFRGLVARGNFTVDMTWQDSHPVKVCIHANKGGVCAVRYNNIANCHVQCEGRPVEALYTGRDRMEFMSEQGACYEITGFAPEPVSEAPEELRIDKETMRLHWLAKPGVRYRVYRATDNMADYDLMVSDMQGNMWQDTIDPAAYEQISYKLTAVEYGKRESAGVRATVNHATKRYLDWYHRILGF